VLALALGFGALAALTTAAATAGTAGPVTIVFQGSYTLDGNAGQPAFEPGSKNCIPQSIQKETESAKWTIRFRAPKLPTQGTVSLSSNSMTFSGTHVWDERSLACARYPAGHLVCRTHYVNYPQTMTVVASGGTLTFHPQLALDAVSDGDACRGQVYNEHPDCGARDSIAVTDFAFSGALSASAPQLAAGTTSVPFDIQRSRSCAHAGNPNPGVIRQNDTVRYQGTFTLQRP
jgi:hypothetical protein